jgi:predicted phage baseplate assembly protein
VGRGGPAAALLRQDPHDALPQVWLDSVPAEWDLGRPTTHWQARADLLGSGPDDAHFVLEVDDDVVAHLRFGDDRLGEAPQGGDRFTATYRVGNGPSGNVGADTLVFVARRGRTTDHGLRVSARNPLPARGGTAPEPVKLAKLLAPTAFRSRLERAIVAEDYAALAARDVTSLQAAGAQLRWTGSWYEVLVSVDERGRSDPEATVLAAVAARLERYRRIGHDVVVTPARSVPLSVRLSVCVSAHHLRAEVEAALRAAFSTRGFFDPDNHRPGGSVAVSSIVATAQRIEGVESVEVIVLRRRFGPDDPARPSTGVLHMGPQEVARADSDPVYPDRGDVRLDLRGGR